MAKVDPYTVIKSPSVAWAFAICAGLLALLGLVNLVLGNWVSGAALVVLMVWPLIMSVANVVNLRRQGPSRSGS